MKCFFRNNAFTITETNILHICRISRDERPCLKEELHVNTILLDIGYMELSR